MSRVFTFFIIKVFIAAAVFAFAVPGSFQPGGFRDHICYGSFRLVYDIFFLSDVRFFGVLNLGQNEYPRLLCSPDANDLFRLSDDIICPCGQSAAASIPVKSKPSEHGLSLCDLYGGCVGCYIYPHHGKQYYSQTAYKQR